MIVAITAYVPIPNHPRSADEYHHLAVPLHNLAFEVPLLSRMEKLENCWLYQYIEEFFGMPPKGLTHSVSDNPKKNTLAYHIVQAQKTEFLVDAAEAIGMQPDVYVWIDYGIFHVPGVTPQIIKEFLFRARNEQAIAIPGCWDEDYTYDGHQPCWRFCGGVMVVPRKYVAALDAAMKHEYAYWLRERKHVSWEVNMLAQVERHHLDLPIWWYKADHDASIFTNYKTAEYADRSPKSFDLSAFFSGA
jgi:hypothetical protein